MAINIEFNAEQTQRLVDAVENAAYAYVYATGYMGHAQQLMELENAKKGQSSYALNARVDANSEAFVKATLNTIKQIIQDPEFDELTNQHIAKKLDFQSEAAKR